MSINIDKLKETVFAMTNVVADLKHSMKEFDSACRLASAGLENLRYDVDSNYMQANLDKSLYNYLQSYFIGSMLAEALKSTELIEVHYCNLQNSVVSSATAHKVSEKECIIPQHGMVVYDICDERYPVPQPGDHEVRVFTSKKDAFLWKIRSLNSWIHSELLSQQNLTYCKRYLEQCEIKYDELINPPLKVKLKKIKVTALGGHTAPVYNHEQYIAIDRDIRIIGNEWGRLYGQMPEVQWHQPEPVHVELAPNED